MKKNCFLDASSAILLYKSGLLTALLHTYRIAVAETVCQELIKPGKAGSEEFRQLCAEQKLIVCPVPAGRQNAVNAAEIPNMDVGERNTILCFLASTADFIITDDGRAARFCKQRKIPFINSLLFPRILYLAGHFTENSARDKMNSLIVIGRYSDSVISFASECIEKDMEPFLP